MWKGGGYQEMEREKVPNKQHSIRRSLQARCLNRKMRDPERQMGKRGEGGDPPRDMEIQLGGKKDHKKPAEMVWRGSIKRG